MKKVFNYVFRDWKISDYVISALALLLTIALVIVSQVIKKPVEVREIFSAPQIIAGLLLVWGIIFCSKDTIHGYVIGLVTVSFFSYGLYVSECYGSFISAILVLAYLSYKLVMKCLKKESTFVGFAIWDFLFLFVGVAACAYPTYMLMDAIFTSNLITETLVVLSTLAFIYLSIKGIGYYKFVLLAMAILSVISFASVFFQVMLEGAGLAIGLISISIYYIVECIKLFIKKKEEKKID